jgi:hypothetical protein
MEIHEDKLCFTCSSTVELVSSFQHKKKVVSHSSGIRYRYQIDTDVCKLRGSDNERTRQVLKGIAQLEFIESGSVYILVFPFVEKTVRKKQIMSQSLILYCHLFLFFKI